MPSDSRRRFDDNVPVMNRLASVLRLRGLRLQQSHLPEVVATGGIGGRRTGGVHMNLVPTTAQHFSVSFITSHSRPSWQGYLTDERATRLFFSRRQGRLTNGRAVVGPIAATVVVLHRARFAPTLPQCTCYNTPKRLRRHRPSTRDVLRPDLDRPAFTDDFQGLQPRLTGRRHQHKSSPPTRCRLQLLWPLGSTSSRFRDPLSVGRTLQGEPPAARDMAPPPHNRLLFEAGSSAKSSTTHPADRRQRRLYTSDHGLSGTSATAARTGCPSPGLPGAHNRVPPGIDVLFSLSHPSRPGSTWASTRKAARARRATGTRSTAHGRTPSGIGFPSRSRSGRCRSRPSGARAISESMSRTSGRCGN